MEDIDGRIESLEERVAAVATRVEDKNGPQEIRCAYCGMLYPPGTPESQHAMLTQHGRVCLLNPIRADLATLVLAYATQPKSVIDKLVNKLSARYVLGIKMEL